MSVEWGHGLSALAWSEKEWLERASVGTWFARGQPGGKAGIYCRLGLQRASVLESYKVSFLLWAPFPTTYRTFLF